MSELLIIEDKIINNNYNKIKEEGFYEINNEINLRVSENDKFLSLYFFSKNNKFDFVVFNKAIMFENMETCIYNNNNLLAIKVYIDSTICSNDNIKDFKDIYECVLNLEKNRGSCLCMPNEIYNYINNSIKRYTDIKPIQEIILKPKCSSKEEILNLFK